MKRFFTALCVLFLVLALIPILPIQVTAATSGHFTYSVYQGKATLQECSSSAKGNIVIPATLGGYPVVAIGYQSFSYCTNVTSVTIPEGVTAIYQEAFCYNTGIKEIKIPSTVQTIEQRAFADCTNLQRITLPQGLKSIEQGLFSNCSSLQNITIPSSVTTIGPSAFYKCNKITNITIPDNVTTIGGRAFYSCSQLKSIVIPDSVTRIDAEAFWGCCEMETAVLGCGITYLGNDTFIFCSKLKEVKISCLLENLPSSLFKSCERLTTISIPNTVTYVKFDAFQECRALSTIYYNGTKEQWKQLSLARNNEALHSATVVYVPNVQITSQPKNTIVNSGKTATVKVSAAGSGLSYNWYYNDGDGYKKSSTTSATYSTTMNTWRNGRKVYCIVKDKYGFSAVSNVAVLTTPTSAKITKQPTNAAALKGTQAKTTLTATGDGLKYTWYFKNATSSKYSKSSITTNTYTMTMDATRAGRMVYCVVTDKYGNSVKSNVVTLSLATPLKIIKYPTDATAPNGKKVTTTLTATGDGLKYEWYFRNIGASTWSKSSLTGNSYYVTMKDSVNHRQVYCIVTDKYGNSVKTPKVTLSQERHLKIIEQPTNATAPNGQRVTTTFTATGDGLKYEWYVKNKGATTWGKSSLTGAAYFVTMKDNVDGRQVYCIVKDQYGNSAKSDVVTLSMIHDLKITKQPANVTVANGSKAQTSITASGDGLTYTWYIKNAGQSTWGKSSATGSSYSVTMKDSINGRQVYCVIKDKYGNSVKSNVVTLKMK